MNWKIPISASTVTAVATGALAILAFLTLLVVGRPYVTVTEVKAHLSRDAQNNEQLIIVAYAKNFSNLPAYALRPRCDVTINDARVPQEGCSAQSPLTLNPQAGKLFHARVPVHDQVQAIRAGTATVKFELDLTYRGLFWEPHRYRAVAHYSPFGGGFLTLDEQD